MAGKIVPAGKARAPVRRSAKATPAPMGKKGAVSSARDAGRGPGIEALPAPASVTDDACPLAMPSGVPEEGDGDLAPRLAVMGCDPVAIIAEIAMDKDADARLRFSAAKELVGYLMLKPRRDQTGAAGAGPLDVGAIIARAWPRTGGEEA